MSEPHAPNDQTRKAPPRSAADPPNGPRTVSWQPAAEPPATGQPGRVGRYEVWDALGEGAFGRVYRAFDPELRREVAIKVPLWGQLTAEMRERFLVEARAAATVHHPNVCPIYDVGTDGDLPYLVMHFVAGPTLRGVLKDRKTPFPPRHAAAIARKLALGVAAAHAKGVIHRDLKPHNVLVDEARWEVLITDFGLARIGGEAQLTASGAVMGTPLYMAPEQMVGDTAKVGPLSDVYALGVIFYELLVGHTPFQGAFQEIIGQKLFRNFPPPSQARPGLDPRVDELCLKAMDPAPEGRFPSAREFASALGDFLRSSGDGTTKTSVQIGAANHPGEVLELVGDPEPATQTRGGSSRTVASKTRSAATIPIPVPTGPADWEEAVATPAGPSGPAGTVFSRSSRRPLRWLWAGLAGVLLAAGAIAGFRGVFGGKPATGPVPPDMGSGDTPAVNPKPGDVYVLKYGSPPVEMRFRWIPPGMFLRGSDKVNDERPVLEITITRGFWMAETECTQSQWAAIITANPAPSFFKGPNRPVESISARSADAFCNSLGTMMGKPVRLPTEAEWEYACRAGTTTDYHFGNQLPIGLANYDGGVLPGGGRQKITIDVGSFPSNAWGLRDMHGNVGEWCQDAYDFDFYRVSASQDPVCISDKPHRRVLRGGCWDDPAHRCRAAYRHGLDPFDQSKYYGFRVCFNPN